MNVIKGIANASAMILEGIIMKKTITTVTMLFCLSAVLSSCSAKETTPDTTPVAATTEAATETIATEAEATEAEKKEAAASTDEAAADFIGKWQATDVTIDGQSFENYYGADAFTMAQIELGEDNKGTFLSFLFCWDGTPYDINWQLNEDGIVDISSVDPDLDFINGTLEKSGDGLIYTMAKEEGSYSSDYSNTLEKVDEFTPIPEDTEISMSYSSDGEEELGGTWEFSVDGDEITVSEVTGE